LAVSSWSLADSWAMISGDQRIGAVLRTKSDPHD
jgi:hypothetical protein